MTAQARAVVEHNDEMNFNAVKVFSATLVKDREMLGERVTDWLASNPKITLVDKIVTQSSDNQFHCLCVILFYRNINKML